MELLFLISHTNRGKIGKLVKTIFFSFGCLNPTVLVVFRRCVVQYNWLIFAGRRGERGKKSSQSCSSPPWTSSVSASNSSSSWSVMSSVSLCVFVLVHSSFFVLLLLCFCVCLYVSAFVFVFVGVYFRVWTFDQLCLGKQQQLFLVCDVALCVWFACRWLCGQAFIFLRLFVSVRLYLCLSVVVFVGMYFF